MAGGGKCKAWCYFFLGSTLTGDVYGKSVYSRVQNGESLTSVSSVQMKLIIQKHDQLEKMRSFIVTIITDSRNEIMSVRSSQVSSYLNVKDFSGLMIVSDLEGNYLDAFQFTDGKNQRVALARTSGMKEECIDTKDITSTFLLLDAYHTGIYSRSGESGGIIDGGGIPEVVVRYCRTCNLPVDQCSGHQNPSVIPPPLEWYCPDCKSSYCPGNCQLGGNGNTGTTPGTDSGVERTPIADKLYHPDSKLTNKQKKKLNQALDEFVKKYPEFKEMYDKLVQNDRKIVFEIDPKPFEKSKGYAGYDALTQSILFKEESCIKEVWLQEEIIHAVQHLEFYGNDMYLSEKNVEFEAKVVQDMLMRTYSNEGGVEMGTMDQSDKFIDGYTNFLSDSQENGFRNFAANGQGTKGVIILILFLK